MGNNTVKFTIITITYNAAQWLERTILSILSQSYGNIEYVIIDGASTDGTVDIIRQYAPGGYNPSICSRCFFLAQ